jgi:CHAT domain-containing protein
LIFKILPSQTIILLVDEMDIPITMEVLQKGEKEWENDMNRFRSIIGRNRFKLRKISFNFEETVNSTPSQFSKSFFEKLYIEVLQPFIEHLPPEGELLLVEPDGPLWQLPLHLILFPDGRYAGDIWPITYTPSFEVYKNIKSKPYLPIHSEDWFFFGGLGQLHSHIGIEFDPLPFAEDEVDIISKEILQIPSKYVFTGNACTVETGHLFIPGSRIVHLATHGEARSDNPLDSFVVLLGGMLTAEDVRNLMLPHCELVTLSACKSGLGKIMSEGMVGLARAFMLAGARSLLVSLWSVEDESTKLIMEEFYKELIANGGHKAKALQAAMNSVRKMPGMQNPESWAPFVLIGIEDCEHNFKTTPT